MLLKFFSCQLNNTEERVALFYAHVARDMSCDYSEKSTLTVCPSWAFWTAPFVPLTSSNRAPCTAEPRMKIWPLEVGPGRLALGANTETFKEGAGTEAEVAAGCTERMWSTWQLLGAHSAPLSQTVFISLHFSPPPTLFFFLPPPSLRFCPLPGHGGKAFSQTCILCSRRWETSRAVHALLLALALDSKLRLRPNCPRCFWIAHQNLKGTL